MRHTHTDAARHIPSGKDALNSNVLRGLSAAEFETIKEAADRHGYASTSTLRRAYYRGDILGYDITPHGIILLLKRSVDKYVLSRKEGGGRGIRRKV